MTKSLIAAAFGGVLASGFLTVSAPVANAYPNCPLNVPWDVYQNCILQGRTAAVPPPGPPRGLQCPPNLPALTGQRGPGPCG